MCTAPDGKEKREKNHVVYDDGYDDNGDGEEDGSFCEGAGRREDGGSSSSKSGRRTTVS